MKRSAIITSLTLFLTSLVSAGPIQGLQQLTDGLQEVIYILIQFVGDIIEINSFDQYLFGKLLLFVIILLIVYTVLKNNDILGDKKSILWIISISISILSIKFIPSELVQFVLFQYGALGAGLTIFFPFIIFLFFLQKSDIGPMPRKIGWFLYGISYIAIWIFNKTDISGIAGYLYWGGILVIALAYIFDKQIHAKFGDLDRQNEIRSHDAARYTDIQARIVEIEEKSTKPGIPNYIRKQNEKTIKRLRKNLAEINKRM